MVNTHLKGARRENAAKKILLETGWLVDKKVWSKYASKDFFNLFDLIAIKGNMMRLIQVKSNRSDFYGARKAIERWVESNHIYPDMQISFEVWLKEDCKPWRCERLFTKVKTHEKIEQVTCWNSINY